MTNTQHLIKQEHQSNVQKTTNNNMSDDLPSKQK